MAGEHRVQVHLRGAGEEARLERALDQFATRAGTHAEPGDGFFMVHTEMRHGRLLKTVVFDTAREADAFRTLFGADDRSAA